MTIDTNICTYSQVCPVVFGPGAIAKTGEKAKELGITKVLIVTDGFLSQTDGYKKMVKSLDEAGVKHVLFAEVTPDPTDTLILAGAKLARSNHVDGIIALGGGSAIDAGKGINVMANNPEPMSQYYFNTNYNPLMPLITIPTTSGTGSELTIYSVITEKAAKAKRALVAPAKMAICDPELTYKLPPQLTTTTGIDALTHVCEAVTGTLHYPLADIIADRVIKDIFKWLPRVIENPDDKEGRIAMMFASNLAGMTISDAMTHIGHSTAHCLGVKLGVPHGLACAWSLPATLWQTARHVPERTKVIADAMGVTYDETTSNEELARKLIDTTIAFVRKVGLKSMRESGFSREDCLSIAPMMPLDPTWPFKPFEMNEQQTLDHLNLVYDLYQ